MLSEQRQRMPIWNCSEWRLPRFTLYSLRCKDSSLWPYSSSHDGRSLTVTLLCGVRTFLSLSPLRDCQRLPSLLHTAILAESESIAKKGFYIDSTMPLITNKNLSTPCVRHLSESDLLGWAKNGYFRNFSVILFLQKGYWP